MKATYSISLFLVLFVFSACDNYSEEKIISKTVKKLDTIQTIEYVLNFEHYIDMIGEKIEIKGNCYFDFRSNDSLVGAKYIVTSSDKNNSIAKYFDGKSLIDVDNNRKEIIKNDNPCFNDVNTNVFIWLSIAKLRKVLPLMQNDSAVIFTRLNDTIISNIESYQFKIEMKNKWLGADSDIEKGEWTAQYNLAIDKSTFLPIQFDRISKNQYEKYSFLEIKLNNIKDDSEWNCDERYSEEYLRLSSQDWANRRYNSGKAYIGAKVIEWTLRNLQDEFVSLPDSKEKHTLLMFWFPGCKNCIPAISILNELERKYAQNGLKIYGVEFMNAKKEAVENYAKEKEIAYSILYNGKEVANEYGVLGAPTFYLIDNKTKTIIYKQIGLYDKQELIDSVEKLLKNK